MTFKSTFDSYFIFLLTCLAGDLAQRDGRRVAQYVVHHLVFTGLGPVAVEPIVGPHLPVQPGPRPEDGTVAPLQIAVASVGGVAHVAVGDGQAHPDMVVVTCMKIQKSAQTIAKFCTIYSMRYRLIIKIQIL